MDRKRKYFEASKSFFFIGLHNIVSDGEQWWQLLFYDIDTFLPKHSMASWARTFSLKTHLSHVCYSTKKGYHLIFLTPISAKDWGNLFSKLDSYFDNYYSGHTSRLSKKMNEEQELISYENRWQVAYPLARIYENRFNINFPNRLKVNSVYEKYQSPHG